jgi:hypothetical protein
MNDARIYADADRVAIDDSGSDSRGYHSAIPKAALAGQDNVSGPEFVHAHRIEVLARKPPAACPEVTGDGVLLAIHLACVGLVAHYLLKRATKWPELQAIDAGDHMLEWGAPPVVGNRGQEFESGRTVRN